MKKLCEGEAEINLSKTTVLVGTPGRFASLTAQLSKAISVKYYAVVLDKVDLLQAMEFKEELVDLGGRLGAEVTEKVIFTTNIRDEKDLSMSEQDEFKQIKSSWMDSAQKALIVRMNDDADLGRDRTAFESIAHLFVFTKSLLDKYILVFNLLKLAILEGKTVIMVNDVTQAYRMKYFLAKFTLRSFVLSTDMPKA